MKDQITLLPPEELPQTDEPKRPERVNCLQDMLLELMNERKVSPADIQKATGIPWGTLQGWIMGDVRAQLADKNLLNLARFFNVSLEYLVYGIGTDAPVFEKFETKDFQ